MIGYNAYKTLTAGLFPVGISLFGIYSLASGNHRKDFGQRLGFYPEELLKKLSNSPRIWIHAASVGEVGVAEGIINAVIQSNPEVSIILSTITKHGREYALKSLNSKVTCIYAPLDYPISVRKAMRQLKPDVFVCLETEIWPNLIMEAKKNGAATAIVNGRISVRSVSSYRRIKSLMQEVLVSMDALSMISTADARRITSIGAANRKVQVNGNAKYDLLIKRAASIDTVTTRKEYVLTGTETVFVAGSTRAFEDSLVLEAFKKIKAVDPNAFLILAPRHVRKASRVKDAAVRAGFLCELKTSMTKMTLRDKNDVKSTDAKISNPVRPDVVVIDTMGDLLAAYSTATIAFSGGSLVPFGGQNLLEAVVWGKPVLYGPSMDDFKDAVSLLESNNAGVPIKNVDELSQKAVELCLDRKKAEENGAAGKLALMKNIGAANKHAEIILNLASKTGAPLVK